VRQELLWRIPRVFFLYRIRHEGSFYLAFSAVQGVEGSLSGRNNLVRFWKLKERDIYYLTARSRGYDEVIVRIHDAKLSG
jgi:hypothetical protein